MMINVHGGGELTPLLVSEADQQQKYSIEAESLPKVLLNSSALANVVMLGAGYFTPLTGCMN